MSPLGRTPQVRDKQDERTAHAVRIGVRIEARIGVDTGLGRGRRPVYGDAVRLHRGPGAPHRPNEVNVRTNGRTALTTPRGRQYVTV
ncbi:hypothetical protein GCM10010371_31350 [Streptomyces subrutilus]|uniref:Uncharacterized protein n=1 Tax=Streptomyces subrutilus TaxID=36818 RepID=A0A918QR89_9ACTN|nr:hypothetical protein GCM10010371_31350 [Streptomyces subrutilus]